MSRHSELKVLIADPDKTFSERLAQRFRSQKPPVSARLAASTHDALAIAFHEPFDAVFVDVGLCGGFLDRLSRISLPLPVIVLSAKDNASAAVKALRHGAQDFLLKSDVLSMSPRELLADIREAFLAREDNAESRRLNQMKDDFLATISHELRTPLTSVLGLCEVMLAGRMGPLRDEQSTSLKKVLAQSHHLVRLINQLLDVRKINAGDESIRDRPVDVRDIVEKEAASASVDYHGKNVALEVRCSEQRGWVRGNEQELRKVVEQLLANALKFTPRNGTVVIEESLTDAGNVRVSIVDTGPGVPKEALGNMFQKFFHADQTLTRPYGGMGLGLSFCRDVIERHGGRIWAESDGPGKGTRLSFLLPAAEAPLLAALFDESSRERSIVWIDDNVEFLDLVQQSFAAFSVPGRLRVFSDASAALADAHRDPPSVIVLDIMMPGADGFEVLKDVRLSPVLREVPILIVSGYKDAALSAVERGADDYCLKPFRIQDVFQKIAGLLQDRGGMGRVA